MHVIVGVSALQVVRCIRSQGARISREWFPEVENPVETIRLPHFGEASAFALETECCSHGGFPEETLADASFPFDRVVSNKRVDCISIDGCEYLDFRDHLELGVFDIRRRAYRKTLRTRLLRQDLPANSLIWAGRHTCFASPEFVIVQLASQMSAVKLAQLIMEFTGYYSCAPDKPQGGRRDASPTLGTVYELPPVTTIERIREFARQVRMLRGKATLDAALDMSLEHAASPPESVLGILFGHPMHLGGYGMNKPLLNPRVETPEEAREYISQQSFYPDIFFPECSTGLEYESTEFHLDPVTANWAPGEFERWRSHQAHKAAADRRRARELEALGIHIIPVIWEDLLNCNNLDKLTWLLARRMEEARGANADAYMEELGAYENRMAREQLLRELLS